MHHDDSNNTSRIGDSNNDTNSNTGNTNTNNSNDSNKAVIIVMQTLQR